MQEIIFVINESPEGGFEAEALGHSIFTEGETWAELKENIIEARDSSIEQTVFIKTLKLKETPEIDDIIKQQQLVIDCRFC